MSWAFLYYLLSLFEGINELLFLFSFVSGFSLIPIIVLNIVLSEDTRDKNDLRFFHIAKKLLVPCIILFLTTISLKTLVPSKRDAMIIAGLAIAEKPVTNTVKEFSPKLKKLIDKELDKLLDTEI